MLITRTSRISGKTHSLEIPVTQSQLDDWQSGTLIQRAMPNISSEHREFLMSGMTPEEWTELMTKLDEDDESDENRRYHR